MQKHPLLSVKQAAEMLRLDERSVRERLINGQLKGEKKSVGLREKWFVYSGSVQQALDKQGTFNADPMGMADVSIDGEAVDAIYAEAGEPPMSEEDSEQDWIEANRDRVKLLAEELVKPLMEKLEAQTEVIVEQRRQIADQDRQLRLLPDLQKLAEERAKDAEMKHVELEALKKQVNALSDEKRALAAEVEAARVPWWRKMIGGNSAPKVNS